MSKGIFVCSELSAEFAVYSMKYSGGIATQRAIFLVHKSTKDSKYKQLHLEDMREVIENIILANTKKMSPSTIWLSAFRS
jgi:hypothetical protein